MDQSYQKYFDTFMILGECRKNYRQATNTYAKHYPNRERKSHVALKRLLERFIAYDTVKKKTRRKTAINDENTINTLAAVHLNPTISTSQLKRECELSRRSILGAFHLVTQVETNIILSLLFIECQGR